MKKLKCLIFISLFFIFSDSYSQHKYSIGFFDQYGYILPTNSFVRGERTGRPINQLNSFSLRLSSQTNGSQPWQQLYKYPSYGLGFSYFNFNEHKQMGESYVLYGFYTANLLRLGQFILKNDFALGIGFFTNHWSIYNLENIAIITPINAYIHEGLKVEYLFPKRLRLSIALSLVHFSNGATKKPNMGLNSIVGQFGLTYNLFHDLSFRLQPITEFNDRLNVISTLYYGLDNVFITLRNENDPAKKYIYQYYPVIEFSEAVLYNFNSKHALGLNFSLGYQENLGADYYYKGGDLKIRQADFINRFNIGSAISYEYSIDKFSIMLEPGVYLLRQLKETAAINSQLPRFFQNVGIRYRFPDDHFVSIRLRAYNFHVAHYLQLGFGRRIRIQDNTRKETLY